MNKNQISDKKILNVLGDLFPEQTTLEKTRKNYINAIAGWYFTDTEIQDAAKSKKMMHLDFEFGLNCSLNCEYCFRKNDNRDNVHSETNREKPDSTSNGNVLLEKPLSFEEWKNILVQARNLGVKSIKLIGAGELMEHKKFFEAIEFVQNLGITPLIFTAAHVIGDDELAIKYHGMNGEAMANRLYNLGASIMVKVNSFDAKIQDYIVGVKGYSRKRDIGLRRLIKRGFNNSNPTRLGLEVAMMKTKSDELIEIYKLKAVLNLYIDLDSFMPCGATENPELSKNFDTTLSEKLHLYEQVYKFNILNNIPFGTPSPYAGGQACSQLGYGLYVNIRGEAFPCPGSHEWLGNTREQNLKEIWKSNPVKETFLGSLSHGCPYREKAGTLYVGWENDIIKKIKTEEK